MSRFEENDLSIGDVVKATGVGEATLRAWERRFGFPQPERVPSGHRRYGADDVASIVRVLAERERGLGLAAAIERARQADAGVPSIFARLREARPDLAPRSMRKALLLALTRAVEDESAARAERAVLIGAFQRERFYRQSERRWRELARGADAAIAFADFDRLRRPRGRPVEVPLDRSHPVSREWALIAFAPEHAVCIAAWEPPATGPVTDAKRRFEVMFTVDPGPVRTAAEVAATIAAPHVPELAESIGERLAAAPPPRLEAQLRLATDVSSRMLERLS